MSLHLDSSRLTLLNALRVVIILAAIAAPASVLAQHHGGTHSHGGGHSHGYAPRSRSHHYSSPRPHYERRYRAPHYHVPRTRPHKAHAPRVPRTHATPVPGTRDRHGRLKRSQEAKREFERETGHPHGWPGHVIDHKMPLAEGGADAPSNMQWQTTAEAKAKDKVECGGKKCR